MKGDSLLQDDDKNLCVHHHSIQQASPHEEQAAEEEPKVLEAHTLAEKHTVMVTTEHTDIAVKAM